MSPAGTDVCILALGSPHGDDRVGWVAAEKLAEDPRFVRLIHALNTPWDVVEHLDDARRAIVIDACQGLARPGNVTCVEGPELASQRWGRHSTHGGSLPEAVALARNLKQNVGEIVVVAVEVEEAAAGGELSEPARRAVDEVVRKVTALLSEWGVG